MDFEKYTERSRGFIQSAQALALREGHQQFLPEHLLKVLLDDEEGLAARLIERAEGRPRDALAATEAALAALPKVSGGGAGQVYLAQPTARLFETAEQLAKKAGDSFVTVERLLLALAIEKSAKTAKIRVRPHAQVASGTASRLKSKEMRPIFQPQSRRLNHAA